MLALIIAIASAARMMTDAHARASASQYLLKHRPIRDAGYTPQQDVSLALSARSASTWAAEVPWDIFCEHVLPYCCLNEPRDTRWRPMLYDRCLPLVRDVSSPAEAALVLNSAIWDEFNVRYEANLSPMFLAPTQVIEHGRASCTGLSLLLVACCRAVGVPARVAGVLDWGGDESGNHVWVEIWSDGCWHSLGAAEPTALNETWFAERLKPSDGPRVFASAFRRRADQHGTATDDDVRFPLPWDDEDDVTGDGIPAVEVTSRYRSPGATAF